jgi:hypothetical protein
VKCQLDPLLVGACLERGCCSDNGIQGLAILKLCQQDQQVLEDDWAQAQAQYSLNGNVVGHISYFAEGSNM